MNTVLRLGFFLISISLLTAVVRAKRSPVALALAGLALIAVDARWHTPQQNPTLPSVLFKQHYWSTTSSAPKRGEGRVFITPQAEGVLTYLSSTNAQRLWEFKRRAEWSSLNLLDRVPKVNGSSTLQTREQRLVEQTVYAMTNQSPAGLLDFLGVAWITSSNSAAEWSPRPSSLPFVTAGQQPIFLEEVPALAQMTRGPFNSRQSVFFSPSLRGAIANSNPVPTIVTNLVVTDRSVEADIDAPAATVAVIAQSFYPTWRATVDGVPTPLLRANVAFQAVAIPPGRHRLQLTYPDFNFRAGVGVSAAGLLACVVLWLRMGRLRRS